MNLFSQLNRSYKESLPEETIDKIFRIFDNLGINISKEMWSQFTESIYSVRIESYNPFFGTNGKGRNKLYALASAYAEYMERLQNGILILESPLRKFHLQRIKQMTGYYFFADEINMTYEDFLQLPPNIIKELMHFTSDIDKNAVEKYFHQKKMNENEVSAVPFYDVIDNKVIYLPIRLLVSLTGSTGMAAGNTLEEAIYQAMCEILERYASSCVYFNRLTPPSIPKTFIEQYPDEYEIIQNIEKQGVKIEVKDFSCGKQIPAVGVIAFNRNRDKYRLNVGCDTSFQVALSRALTEIQQGCSSLDDWESFFLPIPQSEHIYFMEENEDATFNRISQFEKFIVNSSGVFPFSLFGSSYSYQFDESIYKTQNSYHQEVVKLLEVFTRIGSRLYIRNVSFLGFPTVYIYASNNLSCVSRKNISLNEYDYSSNLNFSCIDDFLEKGKNFLSVDFMKNLSSIFSLNIDDLSILPVGEVFRLKFEGDYYLNYLPLAYLFALNEYHNKNYIESLKFFDIFLEELHIVDNNYFHQLRMCIKSRIDGKQEGVDTEVMKELENDDIFSNIDLPKCPDCNSCPVRNYCVTNRNVNFYISMVNQFFNKGFDQMQISRIFNL